MKVFLKKKKKTIRALTLRLSRSIAKPKPFFSLTLLGYLKLDHSWMVSLKVPQIYSYHTAAKLRKTWYSVLIKLVEIRVIKQNDKARCRVVLFNVK